MEPSVHAYVLATAVLACCWLPVTIQMAECPIQGERAVTTALKGCCIHDLGGISAFRSKLLSNSGGLYTIRDTMVGQAFQNSVKSHSMPVQNVQ